MPCDINGCEKPNQQGIRWCSMHYARYRRHGDPLTTLGVGRRDQHGHARRRTPTYASWMAMKRRCMDPKNKRWEHYGGRGISVCVRWLTFELFLQDMEERPAGTSLDRIDVNGDYEPTNCRWATDLEQRHNRRA